MNVDRDYGCPRKKTKFEQPNGLKQTENFSDINCQDYVSIMIKNTMAIGFLTTINHTEWTLTWMRNMWILQLMMRYISLYICVCAFSFLSFFFFFQYYYYFCFELYFSHDLF